MGNRGGGRKAEEKGCQFKCPINSFFCPINHFLCPINHFMAFFGLKTTLNLFIRDKI
jgi:hypothetical protein